MRLGWVGAIYAIIDEVKSYRIRAGFSVILLLCYFTIIGCRISVGVGYILLFTLLTS